MIRRRGALRRAARAAILLTVAALLLIAGGGPALAAGSLARTAPEDDYAGRLAFTVDSVDPVLVTTAGPTSVTVTGSVTNTGSEAITDLIYRFQRGTAVDSTAALERELNEPGEPTAAVPPRFSSLLGRLDPGQSAPFTATVPLSGTGGIGVQSPGVYPLLLNVNGDVALESGPLAARVGELHLVLPVLGVPGSSSTTPAEPTVDPLGVGMLWPFVDTPHLGVGGVFRNDDLATAIAPGGRLAVLLEGLRGSTAQQLPAGAITVVLDPQLLDELDRMSGAYDVLTGPQQALALTPSGSTAGPTGSVPASPSATPTPSGSTAPTSTTAAATPGTDTAATAVGADGNQVTAGAGSADARRYLEGLRTVVQRFPTLLLPLADPDTVALTRGGLTTDISSAVTAGRAVAERVLGADLTARLTTTTAFPAQGLLDDATATFLGQAGFTGTVLAATGVGGTDDGSASDAVVVTTGTGADTGLRAALAQSGGLSDLAVLAGQESGNNWSVRVNALTGLLYQQIRDESASGSGGDAPSAIVVPNRQWSPSLASIQRLQDVLVTLGQGGLINGVDLTTTLTQATRSAPLQYPESARNAELDPGYVDAVRTAQAEVAQLRASFAAQAQPQDPAPVLDALDQALLTAGSTAYRSRPTGGRANLDTVRATLDELHGGVRIATTNATYTLASSSSPLLVTVQNTLAYDVTVTVRIVGGEYVGLDATDPEPQVVPAGRSVPFRIATEVSRSGQFQVSAQVVGADGAVWGQTVPLSVQSSAFGAVTVVIIAVAGAVLLIMVVLRVRQRLQARRARIAAEAAGDSAADGDGQEATDGDREPDRTPG